MFLFFTSLISVAFFIISLSIMLLGLRLGARHIEGRDDTAMKGLGPVEGAVFALMGLLMAFSISGALQRYDERKQLILQEATAIAAAYDRADLLGPDDAPKLKAKLKEYTEARIELYKLPVNFSFFQTDVTYSKTQVDKISKLKAIVWSEAVVACRAAQAATPACTVLLPSLNSVDETATRRAGANERHPPVIIFVMLFGLGLGGSLLVGFGMAAGFRSWTHMIIFSGALAIALFVVIDLEFPRLGLIRVSDFDHFLTELVDRM